jgi:alpha-galactosidase
MAAPLFFSGDMAILDDFTLGILCSPEVIEIDQDPLGRQARPLVQDDLTLIMAKPLADGSLAVGLFNLADMPRQMSVDWSLLGIRGKQGVRDLWRQKDLGVFADRFATTVPRHGVALLRLRPQ